MHMFSFILRSTLCLTFLAMPRVCAAEQKSLGAMGIDTSRALARARSESRGRKRERSRSRAGNEDGDDDMEDAEPKKRVHSSKSR